MVDVGIGGNDARVSFQLISGNPLFIHSSPLNLGEDTILPKPSIRGLGPLRNSLVRPTSRILPLNLAMSDSASSTATSSPATLLTTAATTPASSMSHVDLPKAAFAASSRSHASTAVRPPKDVECWGHRGASAFLPENTLASFQAAIAEGADGIESGASLACGDVV